MQITVQDLDPMQGMHLTASYICTIPYLRESAHTGYQTLDIYYLMWPF